MLGFMIKYHGLYGMGILKNIECISFVLMEMHHICERSGLARRKAWAAGMERVPGQLYGETGVSNI